MCEGQQNWLRLVIVVFRTIVLYVITSTFLHFFTFFQNPKVVTFYVFCRVSYVFSNKCNVLRKWITWRVDIRASTVQLRPGRGRVDPLCSGRRLFPRRRHSAGNQQGRPQLVAGSALGLTHQWAGRTHSVTQASGVADDLCRCREESTKQSRSVW